MAGTSVNTAQTNETAKRNYKAATWKGNEEDRRFHGSIIAKYSRFGSGDGLHQGQDYRRTDRTSSGNIPATEQTTLYDANGRGKLLEEGRQGAG